MKRYVNSFFITTVIYLFLSVFCFFIFANDIVPIKEEKKISISNINLKKQEEPKTEPKSEPTIQPEVIEKVVEKIEKIQPKKVEKEIKKPIKEKKVINEKQKEIPKIVENNENIETPKQIDKASPPVENKLKTEEKINPDELKTIEAEYLSKLISLIEKNKTYPNTAKRLNQSGKVLVSFIITKNGEIKNIKISGSSNFEKLDEAALNILKEIQNVGLIPEKLNKESWEITVPIVYQLKKID